MQPQPSSERDSVLLTTGQVAKFLKVATKTVSQWLESGTLKGYRLPDHGATPGFRRFHLEDVFWFARRSGIRCVELEELAKQHGISPRIHSVLYLTPDNLLPANLLHCGLDIAPTATTFDLVALYLARRFDLVVIDSAIGREEARRLRDWLLARRYHTIIGVLVNEDDQLDNWSDGLAWRKPLDLAAVISEEATRDDPKRAGGKHGRAVKRSSGPVR